MTLRVRPKLTLYDITGKDRVSISKDDRKVYVVTKRIQEWKGKKLFSNCPQLSQYLFNSLLANGLLYKLRENDNYIIYRFSENLPKEYGASRLTISEVIW